MIFTSRANILRGAVTTTQSPVSVVDLWTGYNDTTDTVDGVHPNDSGNAKIANAWFAPMSAAIKLFVSLPWSPSLHHHLYFDDG